MAEGSHPTPVDDAHDAHLDAAGAPVAAGGLVDGAVAEGSAARPVGPDRLLDLIRSVAIVRVVLWHTWSWAWLTWIPAMPAMFFTTGALLDRSLERRGWVATVRQRARRLFIPYWIYAAACWVVMLADGWRPDGVAQVAAWVVPLADPVGSPDLPGLWVPLWYLRAYLWFVLGAGVLRVLARRLGHWSIALAGLVGVAAWVAAERGLEVPFAVGDAAAYTPFVLAGMCYAATQRVPRRPLLWIGAAAAAVAAWWSWQRFGPVDGVVNRSYLLTMLVGAGGLCAVVAARASLLSATAPATSLVQRLNSRALTIYLWQGFGLVAAQRLVTQRTDDPVLGAIASILVVAVVIVAAVALVGGAEDLAAGRRGLPALPTLAWGRTVRRTALIAPGVATMVVALVLPMPMDAETEAPLSGAAVVARAGRVHESLEQDDGEVETVTIGHLTPAEVLTSWLETNTDAIERVGLTSLDVAVSWPDGHRERLSWTTAGGLVEGDAATSAADPMAWWSMTKTVTAAWMMELVEQGVVHLDDPVSAWVPEVPRSRTMTLEQLARHTAGIPSELDTMFFEASPATDLRRLVRGDRLAYEPGEGFEYSRIGYFVLALALERASGTTWRSAVESMAERAGVQVSFDEDVEPLDEVSDPDGHGYRGALWASGGLISEPAEGTQLLHWLFTQGLSPESVDAMSSFSADPDRWYYGLGLTPLCPCRADGDRVLAERFGIDAATGSFAVDRPSGAVVILRPDQWWEEFSPAPEFFDLQADLLDSLSAG